MTSEERFTLLYETLPKKPELWTMDDVESWLMLIRMEKYLEKFSKRINFFNKLIKEKWQLMDI